MSSTQAIGRGEICARFFFNEDLCYNFSVNEPRGRVDTPAKVLQCKIIGVLIRAAREKTRRSIKEVAQRMGVKTARVRQWERGARELTLSELEILAFFFSTPLSFFVEGNSMPDDAIPAPPSQEQRDARDRAIGAKLKQARLAAGKSREDCATLIARKPGTIARYERGVAAIPMTELHALMKFLNLDINYFIEPALGTDDASVVRQKNGPG